MPCPRSTMAQPQPSAAAAQRTARPRRVRRCNSKPCVPNGTKLSRYEARGHHCLVPAPRRRHALLASDAEQSPGLPAAGRLLRKRLGRQGVQVTPSKVRAPCSWAAPGPGQAGRTSDAEQSPGLTAAGRLLRKRLGRQGVQVTPSKAQDSLQPAGGSAGAWEPAQVPDAVQAQGSPAGRLRTWQKRSACVGFSAPLQVPQARLQVPHAVLQGLQARRAGRRWRRFRIRPRKADLFPNQPRQP
jgi:hypothetical protein